MTVRSRKAPVNGTGLYDAVTGAGDWVVLVA